MKIDTASKSICSQINLLILNAWAVSQSGNFTRSILRNNPDSHQQLRGYYLPLEALNNNDKNF